MCLHALRCYVISSVYAQAAAFLCPTSCYRSNWSCDVVCLNAVCVACLCVLSSCMRVREGRVLTLDGMHQCCLSDLYICQICITIWVCTDQVSTLSRVLGAKFTVSRCVGHKAHLWPVNHPQYYQRYICSALQLPRAAGLCSMIYNSHCLVICTGCWLVLSGWPCR